jgi:5'-methylthioadenosine phosphorylase
VGRLAVVGGNATAGIDLGGDWVALNRHGDAGYTLPHRIDHEANMRRLLDEGCDRVLAICSVGGLQPQLGPGTFVCPDDFIALNTSLTTLEGLDAHRVPGFDPAWRRRVVGEWGAAVEAPLVDGGVYWHATGPRLETSAEIRMIARDADVIGMTMASECVIAAELGIAYAAVCVVDNLANGVAAAPLTVAEYESGRLAMRSALGDALGAILPEMATS